jgi:hypothetical protein
MFNSRYSEPAAELFISSRSVEPAATLWFHFALVASLCFGIRNRRGTPFVVLKRVPSRLRPLYAPNCGHFTIQVTGGTTPGRTKSAAFL